MPGSTPEEEVFDLQPFIGGPNPPVPGSISLALQSDDDGDFTQDIWFAPPPHEIWVDPVTDDVLGGGFGHWPIGVTVTLEIDDPANGPGVDYTDAAVTQQGIAFPNGQFFEFRFALAGVFDIQPGHVVTVTDGTATKTLTVADFTVTGFDFDTNTVSGTATPGRQVSVLTTSFQIVNTQADGTGAWSATLPPGAVAGVAYETDADLDRTIANFAFGATVQGTVLGDGGAVLPQSGAAICPGSGGVAIGCNGFRVAFADGNGNFLIDAIGPGTYSVVGFQQGDPVVTSPTVIVDLGPDDVVTCTFTLGTNPSGSCDGAFQYDFDGFFAPVNNPPTLNSVKAGRAIPVKFSLGGDQGLDILADGYPKAQQISCDDDAVTDGVEETVTAGHSSLSYDAATDTYSYVWKTDKAWSNTCQQLVVKLSDGSIHRANFEFK